MAGVPRCDPGFYQFHIMTSTYQQDFIQFTQESLHLMTLEALAASARRFLMDSLGISAVDMMAEEDDPGVYRSYTIPGLQLRLSSTIAQLSPNEVKAHDIVGPLEVVRHQEVAMLSDYDGGCLVPLSARKGTLGVLLVGPPSPRRDFTVSEKEFFAIFANGLSAAAARILLAEKIRVEAVRTAKMEKLAALGRLTAGIAHEFRNPLNIISTSAQTILRNPEDMALHREIGKYILDEAGRLSRTVDEFLQFAKPHTPVWEPVGIDTLLDNVFLALRPRAEEIGIRITREVSPGLPDITTSPQHLERTLVNLGLNAIEAMNQTGTLCISAFHGEGGTIRINVRDTGHGIAPEHQARLFDPFFTTKPTGTGLGLPIVFMLIQTIHGRITYTSNTAGTTFHIDLPIDGSRP